MAKRRRPDKAVPGGLPADAAAPAGDLPAAPLLTPHAAFDLAGSPERGRERVAAFAERIGRAWGASTALPLAVAPIARVQRLPFGILMLDWRTCGGLAIGRVNRIWGRRSTLKSTLCLRVIRSAQATCRHCKHTIVRAPGAPVDCRCPNPRYWLAEPDDYQWLPVRAAIQIAYGQLPEGAREIAVRGVGSVPMLRCEPPAHMVGKRDAKKAREIAFRPMERCEPMRCLYLDSENTVDEAWARANGVDPANVLLVGGKWAEQSLATIEESVLSREFDLIVIDSTSMLESGKNIEKHITEVPIVAARANLTGRFMRRFVSASLEDGLTARYRPTILATSQVSQHGIGYGQHAFEGPTDGNVFEHGLSLDIKMREAGYTFDPSGQRALHGDFEFEVTKNKAGGSPRATGKIRFWLVATPDHPVGDAEDVETVMTYARQLGAGFIREDRKALVLESRFLPGGAMTFGRVGDCEGYLRANQSVYDDLRERVLTALQAAGASLETAGAPVAPALEA